MPHPCPLATPLTHQGRLPTEDTLHSVPPVPFINAHTMHSLQNRVYAMCQELFQARGHSSEGDRRSLILVELKLGGETDSSRHNCTQSQMVTHAKRSKAG